MIISHQRFFTSVTIQIAGQNRIPVMNMHGDGQELVEGGTNMADRIVGVSVSCAIGSVSASATNTEATKCPDV